MEDVGEKVAHHEVVAVEPTKSIYKVSMVDDDALPVDQTTCPRKSEAHRQWTSLLPCLLA